VALRTNGIEIERTCNECKLYPVTIFGIDGNKDRWQCPKCKKSIEVVNESQAITDWNTINPLQKPTHAYVGEKHCGCVVAIAPYQETWEFYTKADRMNKDGLWIKFVPIEQAILSTCQRCKTNLKPR